MATPVFFLPFCNNFLARFLAFPNPMELIHRQGLGDTQNLPLDFVWTQQQVKNKTEMRPPRRAKDGSTSLVAGENGPADQSKVNSPVL